MNKKRKVTIKNEVENGNNIVSQIVIIQHIAS